MRWLERLRSRFLRGPRFERDLSDELAFHMEARARDLVRSGVPEEEARRRARLEFGGVEGWKEQVRETRSFRPFDELRADVRYGLRALAKSPAFAAAAILSLAIGIGVNTAIFSLIDGLWLRPMPVPDGGSLVRLFTTSTQTQEDDFSWPEYRELTRQARSFSGIVAMGRRGARVPRPDGTYELLLIGVVSENFFKTLGLQPAAGRLFEPGEGQALTAQPVVALGYQFWQRRYGGDPSIIGRQIRLEREGGGVLVTVCGILPADFHGFSPNGDRDLWMPPQTFQALGRGADFEDRNHFRWFQLVGRLRPGVSARAASAELAGIAAGFAAAWPDSNRGRSARAISDLEYRMREAGATALILFAVVLLVVVMSAVNVASLLVARGAARTREFSIRAAIGAGRGRIARQMLTESALLGVGGFTAGIALGYLIIGLLPRLIGQTPGYHRDLRFDFDSRVFLFGAGLTLATTFLFGLIPSLRASAANLADSIQRREGSDGPVRSRSRSWLITAQVAMSMTLLALTAVFVASFVKARTSDLGIARREQLLLWCGYGDMSRIQEAVSRLRTLPGVKDVAVAIRAPLSTDEQGLSMRVSFGDGRDGNGSGLEIGFNAISSNFLGVMGTPVLRGHDFTEAEQAPGPPVILISQTMASRYWPGRDPLGQTIRLGAPPGVEHRIVGIVRDVTVNNISDPPIPYLYLPYRRTDYGEVTFILNTSQPAMTLADAARRTIIELDRRLDPFTITTEGALIQYSALQYELTAELLTILGFIGLALTAVGLYGVVAWTVTRRTREIGIRIALGAAQRETLGLVLRQTMSIGAVGIAIGLPLALTATKLASSLLYGTRPWDAAMFASAVAVLAAVLFAAGFIPARRATRIDPTQALRIE